MFSQYRIHNLMATSDSFSNARYWEEYYFLAIMDPIEIRDKEHVITLLPGNYSVRVRWGGGEEDTGVWRGETVGGITWIISVFSTTHFFSCVT